MAKLAKLNIKDTAGVQSTFFVTDNVASRAQNAFRGMVEQGSKGTLDFVNLIFNKDRIEAEEEMCIPFTDIKSVGVVRTIRQSSTVRGAKRRHGSYAQLTAHMLSNPKMLQKEYRFNAEKLEEIADEYSITEKTATNYVHMIRALYRKGELTAA